jgi:hypothetical protein
VTILGDDVQDEAILDGGPMDGTRLGVDRGVDQLCVVMTDGQQHDYLRTGAVHTLEDGRIVPVFRWNGRRFGPA